MKLDTCIESNSRVEHDDGDLTACHYIDLDSRGFSIHVNVV